MRKEFLLNIVLLIAINVIIKPLYIFGVEAQVQNQLGFEQFGLYFDYFNFVLLFQFINDPGLQNWNSQHLASHRDQAEGHLPLLLSTKLFLGFVFGITILFIGYLMGYGETWLLVFAGLNLFLGTVFLLLRTSLSSLGYYRIDSWLSALDKILMLIIIGIMVWSSSLGTITLYKFVVGQTMALLIASIVVLITLTGKLKRFKWQFSLQQSTMIIKDCFPYIWILIFMTLYSRLDAVLLSTLVDDNHYQTGVYAACYRFYDAANMTGYLFAALLLPMFAANKNNKSVLKELVSIGFNMASVVAISIFLVVLFYGGRFMGMLFDSYHYIFLPALFNLMGAYVCVALSYIFGTVLLATGEIKILNYIYGFALVINVITNLIVIPQNGAIGAALAALFTQIIVLALQVYFTYSRLDITIPKLDVVRVILFATLGVGVFYVVKNYTTEDPIWASILSCLICGVISLGIGLINVKTLLSLLSKKVTSVE
jgi:O-antigen/teichoic acid export membrane protein